MLLAFALVECSIGKILCYKFAAGPLRAIILEFWLMALLFYAGPFLHDLILFLADIFVPEGDRPRD